jgi:predicted RNase H-like nuclease
VSDIGSKRMHVMRVVLGIDAAWTDKNPSGVAVATEEAEGWRLKGAFPSVEHFLAEAHKKPAPERPSGGVGHARALLEATRAMAGRLPDLVAIDMPMALEPITTRRASDDALSRAYGAKWCAAHSPNALRPGPVSDHLREGFGEAGFPLCITEIATPGLMEVYPHPALVELCNEPKRLPYKVGKVRSYWPDAKPEHRRLLLSGEWSSIGTVLEPYLLGAGAFCNTFELTPKRLKAQEDMIDAIICCICAIRALDGGAKPLAGDHLSAIWVPMADPVIQSRTLLPSSPYSDRAELRREVWHDNLEDDPELAKYL